MANLGEVALHLVYQIPIDFSQSDSGPNALKNGHLFMLHARILVHFFVKEKGK